MKKYVTQTCRRSSLVGNSETITFFPSYTLVRDMCSLPLTILWTSSGKYFSKPSRSTFCILNDGLKGPRDPALASRTTRRTSLVISPVKKNICCINCGLKALPHQAAMATSKGSQGLGRPFVQQRSQSHQWPIARYYSQKKIQQVTNKYVNFYQYSINKYYIKYKPKRQST